MPATSQTPAGTNPKGQPQMRIETAMDKADRQHELALELTATARRLDELATSEHPTEQRNALIDAKHIVQELAMDHYEAAVDLIRHHRSSRPAA